MTFAVSEYGNRMVLTHKNNNLFNINHKSSLTYYLRPELSEFVRVHNAISSGVAATKKSVCNKVST